MRNLTVILLCSILCVSCDAQKKQDIKKENKVMLLNTKWESKIAEGCTNIYEFSSDSYFTFVSCEMEDEFFGNYYFSGDTLMLDQKGSIYDKILPNDSIHKVKRKLYKVEIKEDKFKFLLMSDWVDGKWVKSNFKFDDAYSYKKVN